MIFKGQPNLFVRISNKFIQRATGKKGFMFDEKGFYRTDNDILIKVLSQSFETVKTENKEELKIYKCKHCDYETDNKGLLMAHYREHKKED